MLSEIEQIKEKLPLYLSGRLKKNEMAEIETALVKYPVLQSELEEMKEIRGIYDDIAKETPPVSPLLYNRISERINAGDKKESEEKGFFHSLREFMENVFSSPRVSWAVVSIQFAIIIILLVAPFRDTHFRTLTSTDVTMGKTININVVFEESATEKEIRSLITEISGSITASLEGTSS